MEYDKIKTQDILKCFEVIILSIYYICTLDWAFSGVLILKDFNAFKFSSCKGFLRVCLMFQHVLLCEGSFHIYLISISRVLCTSPLKYA